MQRGYSCLNRVIMTQNAVKAGTPVEVLVDSMIPEVKKYL